MMLVAWLAQGMGIIGAAGLTVWLSIAVGLPMLLDRKMCARQ
jgi:hypothetical protein